MKRNSSELRIGTMMRQALLITLFFAAASSAAAYQKDVSTDYESHSDAQHKRGDYILVAGGVSPGMTKKEVYDEEGVPDKVNRLPGEEGKEMWVYRCQNDDGFNEDCLHLYFDGDRLVKIDRL